MKNLLFRPKTSTVCSFLSFSPLAYSFDENKRIVTTKTKTLTDAAHRGFLEVMRALMSEPFSVDVVTAVDELGLNSLDHAAAAGHMNIVKLLKERPGTRQLFQRRAHISPLHCASGALKDWGARGNKEMVDFLLAEGADVNARDVDDRTPLQYAAWIENLEVVTSLVEHGADINAKDKRGDTPLHKCFCPASRDSPQVLSFLLSQPGIDVNATEERGRTALHNACFQGLEKVAELLIDAGATVDLADTQNGMTPLHVAARDGRSAEVASLLLRQPGIRIDRRNNDGKTALDLATWLPVKEVIAKEVELRRHQQIRKKSRSPAPLPTTSPEYEDPDAKPSATKTYESPAWAIDDF